MNIKSAIESTIQKWRQSLPEADDKVSLSDAYYLFYDPSPDGEDPISLVRHDDDEVVYSNDLDNFNADDAYDLMQEDIANPEE